MDLHRPPCRGYRANQAFHAYGQMAHLLRRTVQFRLLPESARRHGIRPLVRHVMRTVTRLVRGGRRLSLLFASCCLRRERPTAPFPAPLRNDRNPPENQPNPPDKDAFRSFFALRSPPEASLPAAKRSNAGRRRSTSPPRTRTRTALPATGTH